jgi:hypothetical protein
MEKQQRKPKRINMEVPKDKTMSDKNDLSRITIDLPADLQKKLKTLAALQQKSMRTIVIESIEKELTEIKEKEKGTFLEL